jgi:hypothetical protein
VDNGNLRKFLKDPKIVRSHARPTKQLQLLTFLFRSTPEHALGHAR